MAYCRPCGFWLKQTKAEVGLHFGASFGAAVQLSVGPRRYPRRATQKCSSFQENRELHLTPARFRSGGRLFFGDNARNQSDLFVSPQLAVCGLPASGTKMAMTPNAAEHAKWHAQPCLPGNNSTARQHFTSTDSIFIQYLTENRTHRLAAEISTDSHKRRPMRLGRSLLFSLPMAWLRKFSSG